MKLTRRRNRGKKLLRYLKAAIIIAVLYSVYISIFSDVFSENFSFAENKKIYLYLDGIEFKEKTNAKNIEEFLIEKNLVVTSSDLIYPDQKARIFYGSRVYLNKAKKIIVSDGENEKEFFTLKNLVGEAVREKGELNIGEYDIIEPDESSFVYEDIRISLTRVKIEQETNEELIAFKTIENKDEKLGWRENIVTQKGVKGKKEVIYEVIYHDGEEINRKKIDEKIIEEPISEILTQGAYIKFGKVHSGLSTWYDQGPHPKLRARFPFKGDMFAANPWLPLGSYVKVTNKANGKSVIVRINDRGPFGDNRILDLNKPAFAAIASLGAGVIDVKMEEIKN